MEISQQANMVRLVNMVCGTTPVTRRANRGSNRLIRVLQIPQALLPAGAIKQRGIYMYIYALSTRQVGFMIGLVATTILDSGCYIQCIANGDAALEQSTVPIHCNNPLYYRGHPLYYRGLSQRPNNSHFYNQLKPRTDSSFGRVSQAGGASPALQ